MKLKFLEKFYASHLSKNDKNDPYLASILGTLSSSMSK